MEGERTKGLVDRIAFPVCVASIVAFVVLALVAIWGEFQSVILFKLIGTFATLALASALLLSAARATRE